MVESIQRMSFLDRTEADDEAGGPAYESCLADFQRDGWDLGRKLIGLRLVLYLGWSVSFE